MLRKRINALFNPELYHGWGRKSKFFEGWYFKLVTRDEERIVAIIPGVSMDKEGNKHSFIQVLDGINLKAEYTKFGFEDFSAASKEFKINIGRNHFSNTGVTLDMPGIKGELNFSNVVKWPSQWYSPGIMGPYTFVPFMECNHGIVSMNHSLSGELLIEGVPVDFEGGRGYIEKDWGRSFPEAYIWLQSNHFTHDSVSLKLSIAKIPWLGGSFVGFISGLWFNGEIIEFTTYNSSGILSLNVSEGQLNVEMENRSYRMQINCTRPEATPLASPIFGEMASHIHESMKATLELTLISKKSGNVILSANGRNCALEVAGNSDLLMPK